MSDAQRYLSLISRQQKKLAYAQTLLPVFEEAARIIGPGQSLNAISRWLTETGIKPGPGAKDGAKFGVQALTDFLYCDEPEATQEAIEGFPSRNDGYAVKVLRSFMINRGGFKPPEYSAERQEFEHRRVLKHVENLKITGRALRTALRMPTGAAFPVARW